MDKLDMAVKRIQEASAMSLHYYERPLLLTYSGGKDSDAVLEVAKIAGIPYEIQHSHTTADAPETVRHVRRKFKALELEGVHCEISWPVYKGRRTSMWDLIPRKLMPPTRLVRYCCAVLKETAGHDRFIATGVRWAESRKRLGRGIYETLPSDRKKKIVLNNDNDGARRLFESCARLGKKTVNPIIDWDDCDVWDLLQERQVVCNPLYREFDRVGCIGCPLARRRIRERQFLRWPKYKKMYVGAFDRMLLQRQSAGKPTTWQTGAEVFDRWMEYDVLPGQIDILEDDA